MLSEPQRMLLEDLRSWVDQILDESGLHSYQAVFCGYHEQTLSSLVLSGTEFDDRVPDAANSLYRMKQSLAKVALPAAVMQSEQLSAACNSAYCQTDGGAATLRTDAVAPGVSGGGLYFQTHGSIQALFGEIFDRVAATHLLEMGLDANVKPEPESDPELEPDSESEPEPELALGSDSQPTLQLVSQASNSVFAVVLTHSPSLHLNTALPDNKLAGVSCQIMQMSDVSSEATLKRDLMTYFRDEKRGPLCLLVHADPLSCSQLLINHARHLCVQQRQQFDVEIGKSGIAPPRHVVFVVHLPPGIVNRGRHFVLDYHAPWTHLFVDDLRTPTNEISTYTMLSSPISSLTNLTETYLCDVMREKCHYIISACLQPHFEGENGPHTYTSRLALLRWLSEDHEFTQIVVELTMCALHENDGVGSLGLHAQAEMALGASGAKASLRQSLEIAIRECTQRALAHVLSQLDINCNLHLLRSAHARNLWLLMAKSTMIVDSDALARGCQLTATEGTGEVPNTGKGYGPLAGEFPFSARIIQAFEGARDGLEDATIGGKGGMQSKVAQAAVGMFGTEICDEWNVFASNAAVSQSKGLHIGYLHDFVGSIFHNVPGLSLSSHTKLVQNIFTCINTDAMKSPANIHATYWRGGEQVSQICSIAGSLASDTAVDRLVVALASLDPGSGAEAASLCTADVALGHLQPDFSQVLHHPTPRIDSVGCAVEILLMETCTGASRSSAIDAKLKEVTGVRALAIVLQEMPIGIQSKESFEALVALLRRFDPSTTFISAFINEVIALQLSQKQDSQVTCDIVRRFVTEILFGDALAGGNHDRKVIRLLVSVVNGEQLAEVKQKLQCVALRRSVLQDLIWSDIKREELEFHSAAGIEITGLQLLLEHYEDTYANTETTSTSAVTGFSSSKLQSAMDGGAESIDSYVEKIGIVKNRIHAYIESLRDLSANRSASSEADDEPQAEAEAFPPEFVMLDRTLVDFGAFVNDDKMNFLYAIKVAFWTGGVPFLVKLAGMPQRIQWLPVDGGDFQDTSDLIDPFQDFCLPVELLARLCDAMRRVHMGPVVERPSNERLVDTALSKTNFSGKRKILAAAAVYNVIIQTGDITADYDTGSVRFAFDFAEINPAKPRLQQWLQAEIVKPKSVSYDAKFTAWMCAGCPLTLTQHTLSKFQTNKPYMSTFFSPLSQCVFHACLVAHSHQSWAWSLLFDPKSMMDSFIPTMPMDEQVAVLNTLQSDHHGRLQWYKCPRGHPYTIGECGRPMELAKCMQCGAPIGGEDHNSAKGNAMFDPTQYSKGAASQRYLLSCTLGPNCDDKIRDEIRLSRTSVRVLRLLIHSLLLAGLEISEVNHTDTSDFAEFLTVGRGGNKERRKFEGRPSKGAAPAPAKHSGSKGSLHMRQLMCERMEEDWDTLREMHRLSHGDLGVAINCVLCLCRETKSQPTKFRQYSDVIDFEAAFQKACVEPVFGELENTIRCAAGFLCLIVYPL
jgi:hypothetical protein